MSTMIINDDIIHMYFRYMKNIAIVILTSVSFNIYPIL